MNSSIVDQLNSYVNRDMFGERINIHRAMIVPEVSVLDLATNTTQSMQVLVVYVPHGNPQTMVPVHLGMPSLGPRTIFGEVTMGIALRVTPDRRCVFHSQQHTYEVAIKRSDVASMIGKLRGGAANEESPLNEIAIMELMQRLVREEAASSAAAAPFDRVFPHNMSLEFAATDGQSLFTILPRMKNCKELFEYCFENAETKQARRALPFASRMQEVKMIMRAVLRAVSGLHAHHIAHRDLGLENALLSVEVLPNQGGLRLEDVKVIDFGMAVYHPPAPAVSQGTSSAAAIADSTPEKKDRYASLDAEPVFLDFDEEDCYDSDRDDDSIYMDVDGLTTLGSDESSSDAAKQKQTGRFTTPFYGKKAYAPPECYYNAQSTVIDPRTADMWAVGCMLYMLAFDQQLFQGAHHEMDPENFGKYLYRGDPVSGIRHLLYGRIPRAMVLAEPMFIELLVGLLQVDPAQRLSADEALQHPWFNAA